MPHFAPNNPLSGLLTDFQGCWVEAVGLNRPDDIEKCWRLAWTKLQPLAHATYARPTSEQQREFIDAVRELTGHWSDWLILRLCRCLPFAGWDDWQIHSRPFAGPAVGRDRLKAYLVPLRVFVLPRDVSGEKIISREDYRSGDPPFWPHGKLNTRVVRCVPVLLRLCWLRNLINFTVEPLTLAMLALTVACFVGTALWGNRAETALQGFLAAIAGASTYLICLSVWEVVREVFLVWQEGWVHFWKDSLIRIAGDPRHVVLIEQDSYGLALVLEAFAGLTERIQRENPGHALQSRMFAMMVRLREKRGTYIATGRPYGPYGVLIEDVGGIDLKRSAADRARIGEFLAPVTIGNIRAKIDQLIRRGGRRARLRLRLLTPVAAMKLSGSYRASALLGTVLLCLICSAAPDEWRLARRIVPPQPQKQARWSIDRLQVTFEGVNGNPADYFVIVSGMARSAEDPDGSETAPEIRVNGQAPLSYKANGSVEIWADVSLQAVGGTLDPHRLSVDLYQRRSILGLPLPPIRVISTGVPDVMVINSTGKRS